MTELEEIYRKYFGDVYRFIKKLSGDEDLAEDITSETFFKAMNSLDSFRGDCDIRIWLCQIAKNLYYTRAKRLGKTDSLDDTDAGIPAGDIPIDVRIAEADEADRMKRILHQMDEPYREVFMWRVYGEMSFRQIGSLFGKTENWACVTYHRARSRIYDRLKEEYNEN